MEEIVISKRRMLLGWVAALLVAAGGWIAYQTYKDRPMPPALVYLIPEDYFGPVFVFFDRPDGVDMQPDPLGHSVSVPANGIVKIKKMAKDVGRPSEEGKPGAYYFSVAKDGTRRKMKVFVGSYPNLDSDDDRWYSAYIFENDTLQKFFYPNDEGDQYKYFSEQLRNERLISGRGICDDSFNDLEGKPGGPYCGRFFISSPTEQLIFPDQVWDDFHGRRNTMQEAIDEADQRLQSGTLPQQR